jgi:broad specificity phosphatase PhoE
MNINLYFMRHAESMSNQNRQITKINSFNKFFKLINSINYEPIITNNGIQQCLVKKNELNNYDFDLIICSNLIRTAMTGMFCFDHNKEIIVVPYINELQNFLGSLDSSNKPNSLSNIKLKINYIKKWFYKKNIKTPYFNFEYYKKVNNFDNIYNENTSKFIKLLLDIIIDKKIFKNNINVCIITHGNFIRYNVNKYFTNSNINYKLKNLDIVHYNNNFIFL